MLRNNIKMAWRNIRKNKGFSLLNILGLAIGMTCFLLLGVYILHETSYDRFLPNADRIGYVSFGYKSGNDSEFTHAKVTPTAVAPWLESEFAEVEKAVRLYPYHQEGMVQNGSQYIKEHRLRYVDADFFEVLDYPFLSGDSKTALQQPYQIVLTEDLAKKYFPNQKMSVGQTVMIDDQPWTVTGVVPNPPSYSQIQFSAILSNKSLSRYQEPVWDAANDITLVLVHNARELATLKEKANMLIQTSFDAGDKLKLEIDALPDVHLHSEIGTGNMLYVYIFGVLALSIIIISCVNFTNLSLARSTERVKEIGVRKVLGARRPSLFLSFLTECALMVGIALLLAGILAYFLLPVFADYIGTTLELNLRSTAAFYSGIFAFAVGIAVLAGSWPALAISAVKPTQSLTGKVFGFKSNVKIGNALIIFQFIISTLFIVATLVTTRQLHFLQTKDTHLNRSQIVVLDGDVLSDADRSTLKNRLLEQTSVAGVTASYDSPINIQGGYGINSAEGKSADFNLSVTAIPIEKDFISVFDIPILAGSPLTESDITRARDTSAAREYAFIVNEKLTAALQWAPEEAVGKRINLNGRPGRIKTVVQDFNFASLKEKIEPVVLFPEYNYFGNIFVKVTAQNQMESALGDMQAVWQSVKPNVPFDYHFLDDDYAALYQLERQTNKTMLLFSIITIVIACMGLFALAAFQAQKRLKEMGIRKVLGASVGRIVVLLSTDFIKMVGLAFLIAMPIGWWAMYKWLDNFVYRIQVEWWIFIFAGMITLGITFLTVGGQAFRAARANPVDSLRDE